MMAEAPFTVQNPCTLMHNLDYISATITATSTLEGYDSIE